MAEYELVVRARRAVTPDGVRPVSVAVRDGRIAALAGFGDALDAAITEELPGTEVLLPGLVDVHVRVHQAGQQHLGARQFRHLGRVEGRTEPGQGDDAPVAHRDAHRPHPLRGDRPPGPDHQFVLGHGAHATVC